MNECGDHCQETCEHFVTGQSFACIAVCGPPACICPHGLMLFRDRCVDSRLCYHLVESEYDMNNEKLYGSIIIYSLLNSEPGGYEATKQLVAIIVLATLFHSALSLGLLCWNSKPCYSPLLWLHHNHHLVENKQTNKQTKWHLLCAD